MGIVLILLGLGAVYWIGSHPDLDWSIGVAVFGLSWLLLITGVYLTFKEYWPWTQ